MTGPMIDVRSAKADEARQAITRVVAAFAKRHGFEVMGEIQAGAAPVITPMLRRAR